MSEASEEEDTTTVTARVQAAWGRSEPWRSPGMLVAGFLWDLATLRRIDQLQDNLLLMAYLCGLAVLIVLEQRAARGAWVPSLLARWRTPLHLGAQFLLGGLFSAYVVFYARSATLGRGLLFLGVLMGLLVVNELADRRLRGGTVRLALFGLCAFSFLLFFLPVVTGRLLGFVPAGLGALVLTAGVVAAVHLRVVKTDPEVGRLGQTDRAAWLEALAKPTALVGALIVGIAVLRWAGFVPPVPLALEHVGMFHDVERTEEGYLLSWERQGLLGWRRHDAVVHWEPGETVWCFTAVFAPTGMALDVVHQWWFDDPDQGWVSTNAIPFAARGGREGGFRGYTHKEHLKPGRWAVTVETGGGAVLGEVRFTVVEGTDLQPVVQRVY